MSEECPTFEPDDAQFHLEMYCNADPEDSFDHFEEQRETNVEYLRDLPKGSGDRVALHKSAGRITLSQMLHEWAMHDLGHVRQIVELVRARQVSRGCRSARRRLPPEAVKNEGNIGVYPGLANRSCNTLRFCPCIKMRFQLLNADPECPAGW